MRKLFDFRSVGECQDSFDYNWITFVYFKGRALGLNLMLPATFGVGIYSVPYRSVIYGKWHPVLFMDIRYSKYAPWYRKIGFNFSWDLFCDNIERKVPIEANEIRYIIKDIKHG